MSGHAETAKEFRYEIDHLRNLEPYDMASVSVDLLRLAADALDALLAEDQRLREAMNRVVFVSPFNSEEYRIAREALAEQATPGLPSGDGD